jgi:hypothetical protein
MSANSVWKIYSEHTRWKQIALMRCRYDIWFQAKPARPGMYVRYKQCVHA